MRRASMTLLAIMILLLLVTGLQLQLTLISKEIKTNQAITHEYQKRLHNQDSLSK